MPGVYLRSEMSGGRAQSFSTTQSCHPELLRGAAKGQILLRAGIWGGESIQDGERVGWI